MRASRERQMIDILTEIFNSQRGEILARLDSGAATLRTALAMGADGAILVSDDALSGAGALDTAKVLAKAIQRAEPDLVLAATESTDGYTGTVPEQVAALLGLPSITFAKEIHIEGQSVKVQRQTEAGYDEVEADLPVLVTVTAGVVDARVWVVHKGRRLISLVGEVQSGGAVIASATGAFAVNKATPSDSAKCPSPEPAAPS